MLPHKIAKVCTVHIVLRLLGAIVPVPGWYLRGWCSSDFHIQCYFLQQCGSSCLLLLLLCYTLKCKILFSVLTQSPLFFFVCDIIIPRKALNLKKPSPPLHTPQSDIFHEKYGCSLNLIRLCRISGPESLAPVEILFLNWGNRAHFSLSSCSLLTVIKRLSRGREGRKRNLASLLCVRQSHKCRGIWQNGERNKREGGGGEAKWANMLVRKKWCFTGRKEGWNEEKLWWQEAGV